MKGMSQPVFFTGRDCAEEVLSVIWRVWYVPLIFSEHKLFFAPLDVKSSWLQLVTNCTWYTFIAPTTILVVVMAGLRGSIKAMPCCANAPSIYYIFANVFIYTWVRRPSTARGKTPCFINMEEWNFSVTVLIIGYCCFSAVTLLK